MKICERRRGCPHRDAKWWNEFNYHLGGILAAVSTNQRWTSRRLASVKLCKDILPAGHKGGTYDNEGAYYIWDPRGVWILKDAAGVRFDVTSKYFFDPTQYLIPTLIGKILSVFMEEKFPVELLIIEQHPTSIALVGRNVR